VKREWNSCAAQKKEKENGVLTLSEKREKWSEMTLDYLKRCVGINAFLF
jgi:hypothetical protein